MLFTSSLLIDFLLFLITAILLSYFYFTRNFNYWKERNVYYEKALPYFGHFKEVICLKKTIGEWLQDLYNRTRDQPYFGIFLFDQPVLILKSPKHIKQILIKDFNNFIDRTIARPDHDYSLSFSLFWMRGQDWKKSRSELTPSFTSGKLKMMFPLIQATGERMQKYIGDNLGQIEAKELVAKYSTDVIAKCFFGINAHCFDYENAKFREMGRAIFDFRIRNALVSTAYFSMQNLVKFFKLNFFEKDIVEFFTSVFVQAVEAREKDGQRVNDFIDILRDLKKKDSENGEFKIEKLKSFGFQFFVAGFETTSATISYTLYELCLNKSIQNRLREEIFASIKENKGLTYEGVMNMKYLDMCVKETLRKYPVLPFLDRTCLEDYKLPDTDLVIKKGMPVFIPMFGLHYDEKYFPEPQKYNPDRFSKFNYNENGLIYIPFGEGPRVCIGERFGLMSTKLGIIYVLTKFQVERNEKTPIPVDFEPKSLVLQSKVGLPMNFKYLVPLPA